MADIHAKNCGCLECINDRQSDKVKRLRTRVGILQQKLLKIVDAIHYYDKNGEHAGHKHLHNGCLLCDIEKILQD